MHITKVDKKGEDLIIQFEAIALKPYYCPSHVATISVGCTYYEDGTRVKITDKEITKERAIQLFRNILKNYEKDVDAMTVDTISQHQFNALVSFAYNCGSVALKKSTLLKKVNANPNDPSIADEFRKYVFGGGRKLSGLVKRREAEVKEYFLL